MSSMRAFWSFFVVLLVLGWCRGARAEECYELCDAEDTGCATWCDDDTFWISDWDTDDSSIQPKFSAQPGSDVAAKILDVTPPNFSVPEQDVEHVANTAVVTADIAANIALLNVLAAKKAALVESAKTAGAQVEPVEVNLVANIPVPVDQGIDRPFAGNGDPIDNDREGNLSEPVDPISGEFSFHHIDLSFPGFGVPFEHSRVYRSRVDYSGPLGPGWDHGYNQRLIPEVALSSSEQAPGCGPVLVLTTGQGTAIRFREIARTESTVQYQSAAQQLRLDGQVTGGVTTWTLTTSSGDVRHFDATGLLAGWVDGNGIGLTFTWEPAIEGDWRLAIVVDSTERAIEFRYDDLDRLVRVLEPVSGLEASYEYGSDGGLRVATRGDGRREQYEYAVPGGGRGEWIPEPQLHAACASACAVSSSSCDAGGACDSAVAEATQACVASCPTCASECRNRCDSGCSAACRFCRNSCEGECLAPGVQDSIEADCLAAYDATPEGGGQTPRQLCEQCDDVCDELIQVECKFMGACATLASDPDGDGTYDAEVCANFENKEQFIDFVEDIGIWAIQLIVAAYDYLVCLFGGTCGYPNFQELMDQKCDNQPRQCCIDGQQCGAGSCNSGRSCLSGCENTWLGRPVNSDCLAPEIDASCFTENGIDPTYLPPPGSEDYQALADCGLGGTLETWAPKYGCQGLATTRCADDCTAECLGNDTTPGCRTTCDAQCDAYCDTECHVADCPQFCDSLDYPGICAESCTASCVEAAHASGEAPGPKYGHPEDLDYNLVRVFDGAGNLWLENTYGADVTSPDFDTVIHQRYGEYVAEMTHVDLRAFADGGSPPPPSTVASLVQTLDVFETVDICPYECEVEPVGPRDVAVPMGDLILVFTDEAGAETAASGLPTTSVQLGGTGTAAPTTLRISAEDGRFVARASRRTSKSNLLATSSTAKFTIVMPKGSVQFNALGGGAYSLTGVSDAVTELVSYGEITVFTEGVNKLRVYPGHPVSVAAVTSGGCTKPFHIERIGSASIEISPADACRGEIWLAPLASAAPASLGQEFIRDPGAITSSYLRPTELAPVRPGVIWRAWGTGVLTREAAPSGVAEAAAQAAATKHYASTPMLSAPDVNATADPFYVFHHVDGRSGLPGDFEWGGGDNAPPGYEPPCDPTTPEAPRRGIGPDAPGPVPAHATVVTDLHSVDWTLYADAGGRIIRTVNHSTGATWSFQHDPIGQLTGIEAPDGARQCLRYDTYGNMIDALSIPASIPNMPATPSIRRRFSYAHDPSRLLTVWDPRDLSSALVTYEYDGAGNLARVFDAAGLATTITPVGGTASDQAMPRTVTDPSGAVQQLTWDVTTGTMLTSTADALSATPIVYEQAADEAGRVVWAKSPLGMVTTHAYDGPFLTGSAYEGDGKSGLTTYGYDEDGRLSAILRGSHQIGLRYDLIDSFFEQRDLALDASAAQQNRCTKAAPGGRTVETVSAEGHRTRYHRDGEGRVLSIEAGNLGPSPEAWDDGCAATAAGPSVAGTVASYEYDLSGRLIAATDERGQVTGATYDGLGRLIITEMPDGTSVRRGYDALGNVLWESVYSADSWVGYRPPFWGDYGLLAAAEQVFDVRGRLVERRVWHFNNVGSPIGDGYSTTLFTYDDVARTVTMTDDIGRNTVVRGDGAGRHVSTTLPDGSVVSTAYQDGGRTVRRSVPVAGTTQTEVSRFTAWGALVSIGIMSGSTEIVSASTGFDAFLRPTSAATASGFTSTTTYDAFDRPIGALAEPGEQIALVYDRDDRVVERRSQRGSAPLSMWSFDVDALGRTWQVTDPLGAVTRVTFEGLSSLPLETVDPRGTRFSYAWTSAGRLNGIVADAPSSIAEMSDVALAFTYDPLGRLIQATRDDGLDGIDANSILGYDSFGNVVSQADSTFGAGATRTHTYDNLSRLTDSVLGSHTVSRKYDALDRLTKLRVGSDVPDTALFEYTGLGGPVSRALRNGVRTSYLRDSLGRLDRLLDAKSDGTQLASWTWEMPFDGVPRAAFLSAPGLSTSSVFQADAGGRLAAERHGLHGTPFSLSPTATSAVAAQQVAPHIDSSAVRYSLGDRNSWTAREQNGVQTLFSVDTFDRYTSAGSVVPTYDADGATTAIGTTSYTYDAFGQIAGIDSGPVRRTYQRDALGRLIAETDAATGAVTKYAYDGHRRTFRKAPTGEVDVTVDGAGLDEHVVTILANGQRRYYHQDRLGSVYLLTGDTGSPLEWLRYTAYGEPTILSPSGQTLAASAVGNRFGFQGQAHDWATALVDMRGRHYRPTWGRFLNPDPLGLASGSPNLYAFVDSSPLSFVDPLGLEKEDRNPRTIAGDTIDAADLPFVAEVIKQQLPDGFDPYVVVDDRDAKQSRRVRQHSVRRSLGYVDNAIQVRARGNVGALRLDELLFDTVKGTVIGVRPGELDYGNGNPIASSYETVDGITYPLGEDGSRAFDSANTPNIIGGAHAVAEQLGDIADVRVRLAHTTLAFQIALASGGGAAPGAGAFKLPTTARTSLTFPARPIAIGPTSRVLQTSSQQLQAKFKHAAAFGVTGNYSKANAVQFSRAINQHVNSPGVQVIYGTYHRQPVIHFLDPSTRLNVIADRAGHFISGWRLNTDQIMNVLKHGGL